MLRFQQRAAVAFTCLGAVAVILLIILYYIFSGGVRRLEDKQLTDPQQVAFSPRGCLLPVFGCGCIIRTGCRLLFTGR